LRKGISNGTSCVESIPNALMPFINAQDKAAQPINLSPELRHSSEPAGIL
jgi:hypothetical protein